MPTVEVMARELGCAKQTIRNWAQRLDPERNHIDMAGEAYVLDDELASMIAHEVTRKRTVQREDAGGGKSDTISSVVTVSEDRIAAITSHYEEIIKLKDETHEALLRGKDDEIRRLTSTIEDLTMRLDAERASHEQTRRELALSRALEGFKWPWQRREIMVRYALPEAKDGQ